MDPQVKLGVKGKEEKSFINCVLFPAATIAFHQTCNRGRKEKLMLSQNSFEATNCARMMVGATATSLSGVSSQKLI